MPTVGRWDELAETLRSLELATGLIREVIVVLDGVTIEGWEQYQPQSSLDVKFTTHPGIGVAAARNHGASLAESTHLAFLDDDIRVTPGWAESLGIALRRDDECLTGPITPSDRTVLSRARDLRYRRRYESVRCGDPVKFFAGGNGVVARNVFESTGGFPKKDVGSDNDFALSLAGLNNPTRFCWGLSVEHRNDRGYAAAVAAAWKSGRSSWKAPLESPPSFSDVGSRQLMPQTANLVLWIIKAASWGLRRINPRRRP